MRRLPLLLRGTVLAACLSVVAFAAPPRGFQNDHQGQNDHHDQNGLRDRGFSHGDPVVISAVPDLVHGTLTINGHDFDSRQPLHILFNGAELMVQSESEATVVAALPPALVTEPGTYLLVLGHGRRHLNHGDDFATLDVTIGSTGLQGPQGVQGIQGVVGPMGPMGPVGPQGLRGDTGIAGADGAKGDLGPQGLQGAPGLNWRGAFLQGVVYSPGDAVTQDGSSYREIAAYPTNALPYPPPTATGYWALLAQAGAPGVQGSEGLAGPQGLMGVQGLQGPKGAQGVQGPEGPAGATGLKGDAGPQGGQGPAGPVTPSEVWVSALKFTDTLPWEGVWVASVTVPKSEAVYLATARVTAWSKDDGVAPILQCSIDDQQVIRNPGNVSPTVELTLEPGTTTSAIPLPARLVLDPYHLTPEHGPSSIGLSCRVKNFEDTDAGAFAASVKITSAQLLVWKIGSGHVQ